MTVSRDAVLWGFKLLLGREPESEEVVSAHMGLKDEEELADVLIRSEEFSRSKRFEGYLVSKVLKGAGAQTKPNPLTRLLMLGSCQVVGLSALMQAMVSSLSVTAYELNRFNLEGFKDGRLNLAELVAGHDLVLMHPHAELSRLLAEDLPQMAHKIKLMPSISFTAFHPDLVYITHGQQGHVMGPMGEYQSSLAFYGWVNGLSIEQTLSLFSGDVYEFLGFYDYWEASLVSFAHMEALTEIRLAHLLSRWNTQGCWMHSINHPKLFVLADIARCLLARVGIPAMPGVEFSIHDNLADGPVWPVYPEVGVRLGLEGAYRFQQPRQGANLRVLGLREFVQASYKAFGHYDRSQLLCDRLQTESYLGLAEFLKNRPEAPPTHQVSWLRRFLPKVGKSTAGQAVPMTGSPSQLGPQNPYAEKPNTSFWSRAVGQLPTQSVCPVTEPRFRLNPTDKIATAGSCFAQHLAQALKQQNFNYLITETEEGLDQETAKNRNFGIYSARYGNLYTATQLVQLFDRAYGLFVPAELPWQRSDGVWVDPFRPRIEPSGFASTEALEGARLTHFEAVRAMFEHLDVFIFTLGLTETWRSRLDGAAFPSAPGVVAGRLDWAIHDFINQKVREVVADLDGFLQRLKQINPKAKVILTVSPVPMVASFEPRHVLVSNTYSKAVLRAACDEIIQLHSQCDYFPAFEMITGTHTKGAYFEEDLRTVRAEGVARVMDLFIDHYFQTKGMEAAPQQVLPELAKLQEIVCEEELNERQTEYSKDY